MQTNKFIKPFSLVVAVTKTNGIGFKGTLPWPYLVKDMRHFVDITSSTLPLTLEENIFQKCFY